MSTTKPFDSDVDITRMALALFNQFSLDRRVRLIGVGTGEISREGDKETGQMSLFQESAEKSIVDQTLDKIRERFGDDSLHRGFRS
jgi:hypothetical protein